MGKPVFIANAKGPDEPALFVGVLAVKECIFKACIGLVALAIGLGYRARIGLGSDATISARSCAAIGLKAASIVGTLP